MVILGIQVSDLLTGKMALASDVRFFLIFIMLILQCCDKIRSPTASTEKPPFTISLRSNEIVTINWGQCSKPPASIDIILALEYARSRAERETGNIGGYGFNNWTINFMPLVLSHSIRGRFRSSSSFDADCNYPSVSAHEPGHVWANQIGLYCWRRVWHDLDLLCG